MGEFRVREAAAGDEPAIRAVVRAVREEFAVLADPTSADADLGDVVASYADRNGAFRVILAPGGEIVGCGGLYPLDDEEAEIRKMYFLSVARGHGLGRTLLRDLVDVARKRGFRRVLVETATVLQDAISLYRRNGFVPAKRQRVGSGCDQAYVLHLAPVAAAMGPDS